MSRSCRAAGSLNGRDHGFLPDSEIDQLCLHDMRNYLPGDILAKVDRASMAVSLETRIPLLDPDVVRFALTLPEELRMKDAKGKLILREALKRACAGRNVRSSENWLFAATRKLVAWAVARLGGRLAFASQLVEPRLA